VLNSPEIRHRPKGYNITMPGTKWLISWKDFQTKIRGRRNIRGQGIIGSQRRSFNLGRGQSAKRAKIVRDDPHSTRSRFPGTKEA